MTDEARAARNAYKRAWNAANREKVRAQQERHWEKVAASDARATQGEYYSPELFTEEVRRLVNEKRKAGACEKISAEQLREIARQALDNLQCPDYKEA